jgi:outer membrane protein
MFRKTSIFIFLAALLVAGSTPALAEKIGVVDMQRVLNMSNAGKAASASLNAKGEAMEKTLTAKRNDFEEERKAFEKKGPMMSSDARDDKQRELRIKYTDLRDLERKYAEELKRLEATLREGILNEVIKMMEDLGKKEGYTIIMDKMEAGVVFAQPTLDITDRVLKEYNAKWKPKAGAAPAKPVAKK